MNNEFEKNGYVFVKEFLEENTVSVISQYFENKIKRGEWLPCEKDSTSKFANYADPLVEVFLKVCQPVVERVCGKLLYPTYSYSRIYQAGESLLPHIDRPSCEISATVSIAYKGDIPPIWMQYLDNEPSRYFLSPGDAVIYKGCEVMHWRRPLKDDQLIVQFMLHYVDVDGINKEHKFDKRQSLGMNSIGEQNAVRCF